MLFQLAHPQTRFHLYLGPYSTLRDGFFVSYNFNPDSRTSVSSISSWCSPCLPPTTSSNGVTSTYSYPQYWTYTSSQHRRMESTRWAATALLGPDQRLYWHCPHPFAGYSWGRGTYGWTFGNPSSWTTSPRCCPVTWSPPCTLEAFNHHTITSESQTESQSSPQSTCKTSSPTWQIQIPLLEPIVNLDLWRQTETSYFEGGREVSIFVAGDLDQDGQIGGRRSLYVE